MNTPSMETKPVHEVYLNDDGCLEVWVLTRQGPWVQLASIEITESMQECYRIPLILKLGCFE